MVNLRISTVEELPLQASKWLKIQVLLDENEMKNLFDFLNPFHLFLCGSICNQGEGELNSEDFINHYSIYVASFKQGKLPDQMLYRQWLSPVMTKSADVLYAIPVAENRQLIRVAKPVIQLQAHHMGYSSLDGKFRPMVFGSDSIPWGVQFSYPQLFQDNVTKEVEQTRNSPESLNSQLFQQLQKWMRANTMPTPFIIEGKKVNIPIRIGKGCLTWINKHPSLVARGIIVG